MPASPFRRRLRWGLLLFWLGAIGLQLWFMRAHGYDDAVLHTDADVMVTRSDGLLAFTPRADSGGSALLFVPGALVAPEAYAPFGRALAEAGHPVVFLVLPQRMAYLDGQQRDVFARAAALIKADAGRRAWIVGGHSRGGALAARFAAGHPHLPAGLLLVGTSHPREQDLSALTMDVTKVFGTADGLASEAEVQEFAALLPHDTRFVRVEGGNHVGFGWYGPQLGDSRATIAREEQQRQLLDAALAQLRRVGEAAPEVPSATR